MSVTAARESRGFRKSCVSCRERKARFRYRGEVRADRDHTLCFECYRRERERLRARRIGGQQSLPLEPSTTPPLTREALSNRQIAHRRAMLAHIEDQASSASRSAV